MLSCLYVHAVVSPTFSSQVSKSVNCRDSKTPAIKRLYWHIQGFCFVDFIIHLARPDQTCCLESLETIVSAEILDHFWNFALEHTTETIQKSARLNSIICFSFHLLRNLPLILGGIHTEQHVHDNPV